MRKVTDPRLGRQSHSVAKVNDREVLSAAQRAALAVAADYPVFPVALIPGKRGKTDKKPLVADWPNAASQDAAIVARWWRKYPDAYVGVPMGSVSGLLGVDIDPTGQGWFEQNRRRLGEHRTHQTRRGKHLLYEYPLGASIGNSASQVAPGVDVRGEGGFLLWWPAHGGKGVGEPGALPPWLRASLVTAPRIAKLNGHAGNGEDTELVHEGGRDDWLSGKAYALVKAGWGQEKILAELKALNAYYCKPPVPEAQLLRIARGKRKFIPQDSEVELLVASEVLEKPIDWLWKGFLARNKLHLLSGTGGSLKSTLSLSMAATISTGGHWPDGSECPRGNVIIWSGEDDLSDTVKPRLRFAGADLKRCYFVYEVDEEGKKRAFDPATDMEKLSAACAQLGEVALIIIDPAISVVPRDGNSAAEVRRGLDLLIALGRKHHAAVLGIHHLNKGSKGRAPGERVTGSGAWTQAPRLSLMVVPIDAGDDKVPDRWVFVCEKTQSKGRGVAYEYTFEEEPSTELTRIVWGQRLEGNPHSILLEAEGGEDGSKLGAAKVFLKKLLADGSKSNWDIAKHAEDAGIRGITLKRARQALGIKPFRVGKNSFRWALPEESEDEQ